MLLAEELEVDWTKVRFEQAPADDAYENPVFGMPGDRRLESVRGALEPLRKAGATAREMLVAAAAEQLEGARESACRAENGSVVALGRPEPPLRRARRAAATMPVPREVRRSRTRESFRMIGKEPARLDTPAKVDGSAKFGIDVQPARPADARWSRAPGARRQSRVASTRREAARGRRACAHVVADPQRRRRGRRRLLGGEEGPRRARGRLGRRRRRTLSTARRSARAGARPARQAARVVRDEGRHAARGLAAAERRSRRSTRSRTSRTRAWSR